MLFFWATWCKPCKAWVPELLAWSRRTGVPVVAVSDEDEEKIGRIKPSGVIVVSDGAEDEAILPIIQSRIKVNGVKRVLVKQSPNMESTYYLLKQVFTDPKISHTVFIPPALALLMFSIFGLLGYSEGAWIAITGAVGLYLLFRGLGLDDSMEEAKQTLRSSLYAGKIAFITYILAAMLVVIATIQSCKLLAVLPRPHLVRLFHAYYDLPNGVLNDGRKVTKDMVHAMLPEEIDKIRALYGAANFAASKIPQAAQVFERVVTETQFEDFLTLVA